MSFFIISDVHLGEHKQFSSVNEEGCNSRTQAITNAVMFWMTTIANKMGSGHTLIFAGDFLHRGDSIDPLVLHEGKKILQTANKLFKAVYLLEGNHEFRYAHKSILHVFDDLATVVDVEPLNVGTCTLIPYVDDLNTMLSSIKKAAKENQSIVSHFPCAGGILPNGRVSEKGIPIAMLPTNVPIILGDFHNQYMVTDNVMYTGAPIQHSFGEADSVTGIVRLNDDGSCKLHNAKMTPSFKVLNSYPKRGAEALAGNYTKFICKTIAEKDALVELLKADGIKEYVIDITENDRETVLDKLQLEEAKKNDVLELSKAWLKQKEDVAKEDKVASYKLFKTMYQQVKEEEHELD